MSDKCKGCKTHVVNPVTCADCDVISHPGSNCLSRTGHPWHNGCLLRCKITTVTSPGTSSSRLPQTSTDGATRSDDDIRDLVRMEFQNMRREIRHEIQELQNTLKTEIAYIKGELHSLRSEVNTITTRVQTLENVPKSQTNNLTELTFNALSEIAEKERRSRNIIVHGLAEGPTTASAQHDIHAVEDLLRDILPPNSGNMRVARLGKPGSKPRLLRVTLGDSALARQVLTNKHRISGQYKITDDKTLLERDHLQQLRQKLESLHKQGDTDKSIRYVHGVPRIVSKSSPSARHTAPSKN